jgi:hypothetical protein
MLLDPSIDHVDRAIAGVRANCASRLDVRAARTLLSVAGMRITTILIGALAVLVSARAAHADRWDSTGWTKLGERSVAGRYDHDTIHVGKYEGRFTKLTLVVEKGDLELLDFSITFDSGAAFRPALRHYFREGSRTRVVDLPGDDRVIKKIDLRYKNVGGGPSATVEVWGLRGDSTTARPVASSAAWDSSGWQMLGERYVSGRYDRDRISVGSYKGRFSKLTLVVLDSDLELLDFEIAFDRGRTYRPALRHTFREGSRTRIIDLPGDDRVIKQIEMRYKNLAGGGSAKVQVWAK